MSVFEPEGDAEMLGGFGGMSSENIFFLDKALQCSFLMTFHCLSICKTHRQT